MSITKLLVPLLAAAALMATGCGKSGSPSSPTGPAFTYLFTYTVSTFAGSVQGDMNATGPAAKFNDPFGIAVDTAGNVIVADDGNNKIKMVTPAGVVSTVAGSGTSGFMNGAAGTAEFLDPPSVATAQFYSPSFLAVDGSGNVFVADAHYIREISGGSVSTLYNGTTYSTTLNSFTGVAVTAGDTLVLVDDNGWNVYELSPAGVFTVLAGMGAPAYLDGPVTKAYFGYATAVAIDAHGNILVADEVNQRIRMISPAGMVSTIAGSGTAADMDGTGTSAEFYYPHGIAADNKSGNIYVLEPMSNRIRKITVE
ncbi:MAG TPA: hypothetical protein VG052_16545 [Puia sp.]|jgi:hypothetical protein|nr:hypothetical protein [Puia sp.]